MVLSIVIKLDFLCPLTFPPLRISFLLVVVITSVVVEFVVEVPDFVVGNLPTLTVY